MTATKPSKKKRGKQKAAQAKVASQTESDKKKTHIKFNDDGDKISKNGNSTKKKRPRTIPGNATKDENGTKEGGGKADRSPEMIQQAKYYLQQWKMRDEPKGEDDIPWKFKKTKQMWILRWMYEADVVPKSMFSIVLEYLNGIQGAARKRVLDSANEIIDIGVPEKSDDKGEEEADLGVRLARRRYKRALQVAELLS